MSGQDIQAALKVWRDGLVGLTKSNRLIKFNAPKTGSLLIESPSPLAVWQEVSTGKPQMLRGDDVDENGDRYRPTGTFLYVPRLDTEVGTVARNLMRRSKAEYLDRGISVLYLAFGMLKWREEDGTEMQSPLLLMPVTLEAEGPKATPRLFVGDEDVVLNPALTLRLKEFSIELPSLESFETVNVQTVMPAVEAALRSSASFTGWSIADAVYLSTFSFAKESMFKDLLDNEAQILEHPIVRALATKDPTKQTLDFQFEPVDPADIDRVAPPEQTPLVLDADSSQRVAVAAAVAGKTFVMDGPPGTGKSQTIANMIGVLLKEGKTVLFVSEKMAALDVVRNRLADAGLGSYLLELHSHKASRKEVAAELLKTLDNVAQPPKGMDQLTRSGARERREKLNSYAAAMNEVREPLNMSVHEVIGRVAHLSAVPSAPLPDRAPLSLSQEQYLAVQETSEKLVRAWRPAAQGDSFLWLGCVDDTSLEIRLFQAEKALEKVKGTVDLNYELCEAFGFGLVDDAAQVAALVTHRHHGGPGGLNEGWLTEPDWSRITGLRDSLGVHLDAIAAAEGAALAAAGVPWTALPSEAPAGPAEPLSGASDLDVTTPSVVDLNAAAARFESDAAMLTTRMAAVGSVAERLGLPPVRSFPDVERVFALVDVHAKGTSPERGWFSSGNLLFARQAATTLKDRIDALVTAEAKAAGVFTVDALKAPLAELQDRFTNLHTGLKKLGKDYRADKQVVAGLLVDASDVKDGINSLSMAIAWSEANAALDAATGLHANLLGAFWRGRDTDFAALEAAFKSVEEVLAQTGDSVPPSLAAYLTSDPATDPAQAVIATARDDLRQWQWRVSSEQAALSVPPEVLLGSIDDTINWLTRNADRMRKAVARSAAVTAVTGREHTLAEADSLLAAAEAARAAHAALTLDDASLHATFGDLYNGPATDVASLDAALTWTADLRALVGGALSPGQVKAIDTCQDTPNLSGMVAAWVEARNRIVSAFSPDRSEDLLTEFNRYDTAVGLIEDLRADTVGQQEWFDYTRARADLATLGLDTAVDFAIEQRIPAADVPKVIDRALLRAWVDATIQKDTRLQPLLATDREALVEEYRDLDRRLVATAVTDIVNAANSRRPKNTAIGEPGLIRKEGMKQKRHIPVRDLIAGSRNTTTAIKPVFMMSPLAVSQYLPNDLVFDVVIFDEASQVTPGDAVNCIYRGKSLILAGDDKQLPPTSFFERQTDDEDDDTDVQDFQSVLELSKACGAFNNLGLRWHYRSRHEDLIAFSNYKFYDGKLVTYPSSHTEGDNVGVAYFNANGTYQRGGGAYNPVEAAAVADRVIEHFTNRPELTLGVVTFSVAQADAVQAAVDKARESRRDLDRFFDGNDRLDGFFIRSLESVQGDERDVIIFSVGYGPDEAGRVSSNFGVLNKDRGWRRLNVGITRARQRVEVVASMRAGDIPPSTNENVEYFRAYLDYAEKGTQVLAVPYSSTGLDPDSPFEESVINVIRGWGYTIEPQVGAAGFRVDIGVRHPAHPGMFAIGIECDGFQYHSAPAARDRDRLRDQILTGLGWRLHRIWGTAWYRDRANAETELRAAIEAAIAAPLDNRTKKTPAVERGIVETVTVDTDVTPTWTTEYKRGLRKPLAGWVNPGEPGNHLHMVDAITYLAEAEGPIHISVMDERLRDWWDIGRIGPNIRRNIDLALQQAKVVRDGDFIDIPDRTVHQVRVPANGVNRKAEHVHIEELALAAGLLINDVGAAARSEVVLHVARLFDWTRTGHHVDRYINAAIDRLITDGEVIENNSTLTLNTATA